MPGVASDDGVDGRAADERDEPEHADEARRRGEGKQVVAAQERLQEHVVEREASGAPRTISGPLALSNERLSPDPRATTIATPANATGESEHLPARDALEPDRSGEHERHAGRERDNERSDARGRVTLPDVQEQVVADDDDEPGRGDAERVRASQPR